MVDREKRKIRLYRPIFLVLPALVALLIGFLFLIASLTWVNNADFKLDFTKISVKEAGELVTLYNSENSTEEEIKKWFDEINSKNPPYQKYTKEIGYTSALNWSYNSIILVPMIFILISLLWFQLSDLPDSLVNSGMIRREDGKKISISEIKPLKNVVRIVVLATSSFILIIFVIFSVYDFNNVAGQYYENGINYLYPPICPNFHPEQEIDWSVKAVQIFEPKVGQHIGAAYWFGLLNYIWLSGVVVSIILSSFLIGLFACLFYSPFALKQAGFVVVLDRNSSSRRLGFGRFGRIFRLILFIAFLSLGGLYLAHIQNLYLRSCAPNIFEFIKPAFSLGMIWVSESIIAGVSSGGSDMLKNSIGQEWNRTSNISAMLSTFIVVFSFLVVWIVLSLSAEAAKHKTLQMIADGRLDNTKDGDRSFEERVKAMPVHWPVNWPTILWTCTLLVIGLASFYLWPMLIVLLGIIVGSAFVWLAGNLRKIWASSSG